MANQTVIKLQDGNVMPQLGLGVWKAGNDEVVSAIHKALEVGYRSIDTAAAYKNEDGVGTALASAGVPRDELFITTKLWNDDQKRPREALQESLEKLQLDFVDLYLMHWPVPAIDHYVDAWKGMIELQKEGLVKSIGVCNFQVHHLQRLIDETGIAPVINQIELHPLMQQRQLHAWNATHKIQTESWSPWRRVARGSSIRKSSATWRINTAKRPHRSSFAGIWTTAWSSFRNQSRHHVLPRTSTSGISAWTKMSWVRLRSWRRANA